MEVGVREGVDTTTDRTACPSRMRTPLLDAAAAAPIDGCTTQANAAPRQAHRFQNLVLEHAKKPELWTY